MFVEIPVLKQELVNGKVVSTEENTVFDVDTSVYSEERWEQNFPMLAQKEGLFQYIDHVQKNTEVAENVRVAAMLKAVYCFLEAKEIPTYKSFAQMFKLSDPEYTERLIKRLTEVFKQILGGSSTKNL